MRHDTITFFAALGLLDGTGIGDGTLLHRHQEFIRFLRRIDATTLSVLDLYLIVDNCSTHKHALVQTRRRYRCSHLHVTPAPSSWLNLVEGRFADLTIEGLARGSFGSLAELIAAIHARLDKHNQTPGVNVLSAPVAGVLAEICHM